MATLTLAKALNDGLRAAMERDPKVAVLTAAMCEGNKLQKIRDAFPDRFFDTGICESHAVAFAAGMAKAGARPVVDIYSTFLQRSYDQIFQEVALQDLPVRGLHRRFQPALLARHGLCIARTSIGRVITPISSSHFSGILSGRAKRWTSMAGSL